MQDVELKEGTIKWFNPHKGYGFIVPHDGGRDVFLHRECCDVYAFEPDAYMQVAYLDCATRKYGGIRQTG